MTPMRACRIVLLIVAITFLPLARASAHSLDFSPSPSPPDDDHDHGAHDHGAHDQGADNDHASRSSDSSCGADNGHDHSHMTTAHVAHGAVMGIALLAFFPSGVFVARRAHLGNKAQGHGMGKTYFSLHVTLQLTGAVLLAVGMTLALTMVECHFWEGNVNLTHGTLGCVLCALVLTQLMLGLVRPSKESVKRPIWRATHRIVGVCFLEGMFANAVLGAWKWVGDGVTWPVWLIVAGGVLWHLVFMMLQVLPYVMPATMTVPTTVIQDLQGGSATSDAGASGLVMGG